MAENLSRRSAMGLGAAAVTAATFGSGSAASAAPARTGPACIAAVYQREKTKAGGLWHSHIAMVDDAGVPQPVVADGIDFVTNGYSVQKLAVATAVMDKVDRGELSLGQKLDLQSDIILGGSGIYFLHGVWGDDITIANFLTAMLLMSDNTAVRMCGRVVPALEINEILATKGFVHTRVKPVTNPNRFLLGTTTPRETHDLLWRLATKTLLSPKSCDFILSILRWLNGYHDGVRRVMSSAERGRTATKYGSDYTAGVLAASRHEVGIMFGADGSPKLTYAMFAQSLGDVGNWGSTHPAVQAHAVIGRTMFDNLPKPTAAAAVKTPRKLPTQNLSPFQQVNGG